MQSARSLPRLWALLALRGTRALLTALRYRILVGVIAAAYALSAMIFGGMLYIAPAPSGTGAFFYIYPSGPGPSWTYPAILAGNPYFRLDLPFISAILMTLSAAGVGLGMALAVLLGVRLIRRRKAGLLGPAAIGSAAGLTPAMIALVTLGACCSTTAAATAGISLAAQSSGTNAAALLANTWYLGLFQVVVIYVALIAQEQLVSVYGLLFGGPELEPPTAAPRSATVSPVGWREVAGAILRIALIATGLTWSLSMFAGWIATPPGAADAWAWLGWIVQHQVPGVLAVIVGLFPTGTLSWWARLPRVGWGPAARGTLIVSGVALLSWIPFPASQGGAAALGNELLGFWRFPAGWGAVAPPALGLTGLLLRWTFQFGLLGLFAVSMGISPEATLRPLLGPSAATSMIPAGGIGRKPAAAASPAPVRSGSFGVGARVHRPANESGERPSAPIQRCAGEGGEPPAITSTGNPEIDRGPFRRRRIGIDFRPENDRAPAARTTDPKGLGGE